MGLLKALAEYAAIVEQAATDYTNSTTIQEVRTDHPELDFMDDDEIQEILDLATKKRR